MKAVKKTADTLIYRGNAGRLFRILMLKMYRF